MDRRDVLKGVGGTAAGLQIGGCLWEGGPDDEFPSEPITVIVPFGVGGGFDFYARLVAEVMDDEDHVPVETAVRNVEGAAGITGTNQIWNADPDGYTLGIQHGNLLPLDPITSPDIVEYNPGAVTYLTRVGGTIRAVAVATETGIETGDEFLEAARNDDLTFAHQGPESSPAQQMLALAVLGGEESFSIDQYERNSVGYDGRSEEYTALLRGEVQVLNGSFRSLQEFAETGDLRLVLFFTTEADCPAAVKNQGCDTLATLDADLERIDETISFTGGQCHRYFIAPPGIPDDRHTYLCTAISDAINDPTFRERVTAADRDVFFGDCEQTRNCVLRSHETFRNNKDLLEEFGFLD